MIPNHTSDQHPWFQASRDPDHPEHEKHRDWYVWSPTDQRYQEARIIFLDYEGSNWTWDPVREAYFWHRFFHHQPDLNFDNPAVQQEMLDVFRFWMDLGEAYTVKADHHGAREAFERALSIDPNHVSSLFNLALAYQNMGRTADAVSKLEQLLEIAPGNRRAAQMLDHLRRDDAAGGGS